MGRDPDRLPQSVGVRERPYCARFQTVGTLGTAPQPGDSAPGRSMAVHRRHDDHCLPPPTMQQQEAHVCLARPTSLLPAPLGTTLPAFGYSLQTFQFESRSESGRGHPDPNGVTKKISGHSGDAPSPTQQPGPQQAHHKCTRSEVGEVSLGSEQAPSEYPTSRQRRTEGRPSCRPRTSRSPSARSTRSRTTPGRQIRRLGNGPDGGS